MFWELCRLNPWAQSRANNLYIWGPGWEKMGMCGTQPFCISAVLLQSLFQSLPISKNTSSTLLRTSRSIQTSAPASRIRTHARLAAWRSWRSNEKRTREVGEVGNRRKQEKEVLAVTVTVTIVGKPRIKYGQLSTGI